MREYSHSIKSEKKSPSENEGIKVDWGLQRRTKRIWKNYLILSSKMSE